MEKEHGFWIDENNNSWSIKFNSEKEAEEKAKSLVGCYNCCNCRYCSNCYDCSDCHNCVDCCDCSDCNYSYNSYNCHSCQYCSNCYECRNCYSCTNCSGCSDFKTDPQIFRSGPIGSRKSRTTFYWIGENIQVVTGCFKGTLEEFENAITKTHGNSEYAKEYFALIEKFKKIM